MVHTSVSSFVFCSMRMSWCSAANDCRIRGFHGMTNTSYYHSHNALQYLQDSYIGVGWWREWRNGWTDDGGGVI